MLVQDSMLFPPFPLEAHFKSCSYADSLSSSLCRMLLERENSLVTSVTTHLTLDGILLMRKQSFRNEQLSSTMDVLL